MKNKYSITLLLLLFVTTLSAQRATISGYVIDSKSKEPIIGANIYQPKEQKGTTSNSFGFYSINVSKGETEIRASFVGYSAFQLKTSITKDTVITILLEEGKMIDEVSVVGEAHSKTAVPPVSLTSKQVRLMPSLTGEADLMKAYQYLPGISGGSEGDNSLYVRGGSPDQNLILLDDIPLYYVNHIGGLVSIFDENAVNDVAIYKGGFPARYGGRLSSVIDIRMKNGNMQKLGGEVSVGLISSKLSVEGPIIKDKMSFMLTARKSMTDLYMRPISYISMDKRGYMIYSFYDLNAKLNFKLSDKDRFYLSAYRGTDNSIMSAESDYDENDVFVKEELADFTYDARSKYDWGNTMGCFRWNHIFGNKLFSNLTIATSHYFYQNRSDNTIEMNETKETTETFTYQFLSGISDRLAKLDFDYYPANNHHIKFGGLINSHHFDTGTLSQKYDINEEAIIDSTLLMGDYDSEIDTTYGSDAITALETSAYLEDEMELFRFLTLNVGLHFAQYHHGKENFHSLQPRFSLKADLGNNLAVNVSYVHMAQFIHMLTGSDTSTPTDIWLPATNNAIPEKSVQYSIGAEKTLNKKGLKITLEGFYKTMENLIDYKLGYNLLSNSAMWYDKIETGGTGKVYGLEFLLEKKTGKLTGWLGYTWSKNMRQFEKINNGVAYHYVYDRPHDVSLVANYELSKKITFSASWEYQSGRRMTIGTAGYDANHLYTSQDLPPRGAVYYIFKDCYRHQFGEIGYDVATIYGTKNNYKLPDYHKLNVSAHFTKQKKHGIRTWSVGIQNLYNRMNAYNVYYSTDDNGKIVLKKMTMFPIMPNINYSFRF
ncbi:MAG TPA: TonB-dependent receptor [Prolixibacteraceae bacterium]|nr:TonB-dependent receptor [Prolixibacteraceae bacterium]